MNGFAFSMLAGLALWIGVSVLSGQREPWDGPAFWVIGYPAALAISALAGFLWPARAALWGPLLMLMMAPVMARSGAGLSLLPLGLAALGLLSLPTCAAGRLGALLRRVLSRA